MIEPIQKVRKSIADYSLDRSLFEGSINDIIDNLNNLRLRNPGFDEYFIDLSIYDEGCMDVELYGERNETEEEQIQRLDLEERTRAAQESYAKIREQKEYARYLELKAKYEKAE